MIAAFVSALILLSQQHHTADHTFEDVDRWVAAFESPERDLRQKPDEVVAALKLSPSDRIADIGAGTGYFTRRFARAVGDEGLVFAVDIEPNLLRYLSRRARTEGLSNIVPVLALPDDPVLPPGALDVIFICNTVHHIENRPDYYRLLERSLAPGGRLVIVDFRKDASVEQGPPVEMRLDQKELEREIAGAGFRLAQTHDFLPDQYFLVFTAEPDR